MAFKQWKVGNVVSSTELKKQFGDIFDRVLAGSLDALPKEGRERTKYKVTEDLPKTEEEYNALKVKRFTTTVDALVDDAFAEIDSLADEMREAYENTPDSLKEGDVGSRRNEAADALESLRDDHPDVPDEGSEIQVYYVPPKDQSSRPKRASAAADMLATAASEIRSYIENYDEEEDEEDGEGTEKEEKDFSELESLADTLEEKAEELEGIDFPGMYG